MVRIRKANIILGRNKSGGRMFGTGRKTRQGVRRRRPVLGRTTKRKVDYARVVESAQLPIITNATGQFGMNYFTALSDFQRAQEVAHAYKYYRCAKVELEFVPYATFAVTNGAAAARMPQLYFSIDRVANMYSLPTEAEMLERGCSPKLFKQKYKFVYKPSLLQNIQMETGQPADGGGNPLGMETVNAINSVPLFNKWLPTQQSYSFTRLPPNGQIGQQVSQPAVNPYALKYYGSIAVIQIDGGNEQQIGDLMTKVTWEFKGPRVLKGADPVAEPVVSPATSTINPGVVPNSQPTDYP